MSRKQTSRSPADPSTPRSAHGPLATSDSMQATELRISEPQMVYPRYRTGPQMVAAPVRNESDLKWGSRASRLTNLTITPARLGRLASSDPRSAAVPSSRINEQPDLPYGGSSSLRRVQRAPAVPNESPDIRSGPRRVNCAPELRSGCVDMAEDTPVLPLVDYSSSDCRGNAGQRKRKEVERRTDESMDVRLQLVDRSSSERSSTLRTGREHGGGHSGLTSGTSGDRSTGGRFTSSGISRGDRNIPASRTIPSEGRSESRQYSGISAAQSAGPQSRSTPSQQEMSSRGISAPRQASGGPISTGSRSQTRTADSARPTRDKNSSRSEDAAVTSAEPHPSGLQEQLPAGQQMSGEQPRNVLRRNQSAGIERAREASPNGRRKVPGPDMSSPGNEITGNQSPRAGRPKRRAVKESLRPQQLQRVLNEPGTIAVRRSPRQTAPSASKAVSRRPGPTSHARELRNNSNTTLAAAERPVPPESARKSNHQEPYEVALLGLIVETDLDLSAYEAQYNTRYTFLLKKYLDPPISIPDKELKQIQTRITELRQRETDLRTKLDGLRSAPRQTIKEKMASGRCGPNGYHPKIKEISERSGPRSRKCIADLQAELARQALLPEQETDHRLIRQIEAYVLCDRRRSAPSDSEGVWE